MSLVSIGSHQLAVEITGEGPDLLLIAGLGGRGSFWQAQRAALRDRFRVIGFDHRGIGGSPPTTQIGSTADLADDTRRLLDALAIERVAIVGHSTGGAIGQHLALAEPDRIARLVLSSSWAGPDPLFAETMRLRRRVLVECGPDAYFQLGTLLATPAWWLHGRYDSAERYDRGRIAGFAGMETELARLDAIIAHDLRDRLPGLRVPTLVCCARDDQLTSEGDARTLAALIPGARLHLFPDGGHFVPITRTEAYNRVIADFLEDADA